MGRNASIPVACCFFAARLQSQPNTAGSKKQGWIFVDIVGCVCPSHFFGRDC